jgi:hypothetical protein
MSSLKTGRVVVRRQRVSVGYKIVERDTKAEAGQDYITKIVSRLLRRAGIPGKLHALRQFRAAWLISMGYVSRPPAGASLTFP